jgi:hypothetical protein
MLLGLPDKFTAQALVPMRFQDSAAGNGPSNRKLGCDQGKSSQRAGGLGNETVPLRIAAGLREELPHEFGVVSSLGIG